jgi:hypothetical protein
MSRLTPFDLIFDDGIEDRFRAVKTEAELAQRDFTDPAQFASLSTVQRLLTEIESPTLLEKSPLAAAEYLILLYAAFRFWEGGKQVTQVKVREWDERFIANFAISTSHTVASDPCYLQLPEQRFWAQIDSSAPHEPLDGCYVAMSRDGRQVVVVAILGLRKGRSGFSQVSLTVTPQELVAARAATRSPAFAPLMEGGGEAGFKSVGSQAELLVLTQLALAQAYA